MPSVLISIDDLPEWRGAGWEPDLRAAPHGGVWVQRNDAVALEPGWLALDVARAGKSLEAMSNRTIVLDLGDGAGDEALEPSGVGSTARPTEPLESAGARQ